MQDRIGVRVLARSGVKAMSTLKTILAAILTIPVAALGALYGILALTTTTLAAAYTSTRKRLG